MLNQHHQAATRAFVLLLFVACINGIVGAVAVAPVFAADYSPNGFKVLEASVRRASKSKLFKNYQVKHCVHILSDALKLSRDANEDPNPGPTHAQLRQFWAQVDSSRESLLIPALIPIAQAVHKEYKKFLLVAPPATAENPSFLPTKEDVEEVFPAMLPILDFFLPKVTTRIVWPRHDGPMLFAEAFFRIAWPQASRRPVEYTEALMDDLGDFMIGRGYAFGVFRGLFFNRNTKGLHPEFDISPVFTSDRWDFAWPIFLKLAHIAYDKAEPYADMQLDILKVLELALEKKRHQKLHRSRALQLASHLVTEFSKNTELKRQIYKIFIVEHSLSTHEKMHILSALGHKL